MRAAPENPTFFDSDQQIRMHVMGIINYLQDEKGSDQSLQTELTDALAAAHELNSKIMDLVIAKKGKLV